MAPSLNLISDFNLALTASIVRDRLRDARTKALNDPMFLALRHFLIAGFFSVDSPAPSHHCSLRTRKIASSCLPGAIGVWRPVPGIWRGEIRTPKSWTRYVEKLFPKEGDAEKVKAEANTLLKAGKVKSHTKCFSSRFTDVNSPKNPSTYPLLLATSRRS